MYVLLLFHVAPTIAKNLVHDIQHVVSLLTRGESGFIRVSKIPFLIKHKLLKIVDGFLK